LNVERVLEVIGIFLPLSIATIGGGNIIIPEMHRQIVADRGWISDAEFAQLVTLIQVAPGPNILMVSLIGRQIAGWPGAVAATLALLGPTFILTYVVARLMSRLGGAPSVTAIQQGLAPLAFGLTLASGFILAQAADTNWVALGVTALATVVVLRSNLHPLWLMFGAAVLANIGLL
jgi:chromate transporter